MVNGESAMSDMTENREAPEPRLVALFLAAVTVCALWAEQPNARAFDRGLWHEASGWPFASTFYPRTTTARHLPLGEVANVLALGLVAISVYVTTLHVGRWVANRGRVSVKGAMLALTTAAVASAVLVGRFDGLLQGAFRSLGLVPTGIDGRNLWLMCARISMAHVMCFAAVWGVPAVVRRIRDTFLAAMRTVPSHDPAAAAE
jgi:hypothetical protein